MPEEWRSRVLVPIFMDKGDVQRCSDHIRNINLISLLCRYGEGVVEARLIPAALG